LCVPPLRSYGDGADYWSPQVDRGGSLPFQTIALDQGFLDQGLWNLTSQLIGFYFDNYVVMPEGNLTTGDWELSCPDGFADGLADYGEMQDLFWRTARAVIAQAEPAAAQAWLDAHMPEAFALANHSFNLRLAAIARNDPVGSVTRGLIYGSPEHDTCHEPDFYNHNNVWFLRGQIESGKFLRDVCPIYCPQYAAFGQTLLDDAAVFRQDLMNSFNLSVVRNATTGLPYFVPPIAQLNAVPFSTMTQDTLSSYSNFRYYAELLGADILPEDLSVALQDFRENTGGTVSGITRWTDHLDDMPSSYYAAASLRDDRIERFQLLMYGHMANYQGRGTFTATEQLPITPDANGLWRDYLWDYLEGGIDQCVPSIMLAGLATRWALVYERYDTDTVWLNKGAPLRWADPTAAPGGYGVDRALVRFGLVSVHAANTLRGDGSGQDSTTIVNFFVPANTVPGTTTAPQFAVRVLSSDPRDVLDPSAVQVSGDHGVVLAGVDAANGLVYVNITAVPEAGETVAFAIGASLVH
jgi:hypothetical protein